MDPECFHGRATVTSDLYSLGIVLYEMVTGELPFSDFKQRFDGPPRPPGELVPDLPIELDEIIARAVTNDLSERFPDATAMLKELRKLTAKLSPLPPRFTRLAELPGGRSLCQDEETGERVAVRLVNTAASLAEFAQQCNRLEELSGVPLELPLRHFTNEQFVGIVSRVPSDPDLHKQYSAEVLGSIGRLQELCDVLASVCDAIAILHREAIIHGLLSPFAVTVGRDGARIHEVGNSPILRVRRMLGAADDSLESLGQLQAFMSPQILAASHDPSPADDIFSLGAIMHLLLTGLPVMGQEDRHRLILGGSVAEVLCDVRKNNILVPPRLAAATAKAVRFSVHDRFDNIARAWRADPFVPMA